MPKQVKKPRFVDEVIIEGHEAEQLIANYIRLKKPQYQDAVITVEPIIIKADVEYRGE